MGENIESELSQLPGVYINLINNQADLARQLHILLKKLVFENRYTLHPSMLDKIAHEEADSFLAFLSSGDRPAVFKHGQNRVDIG